MSTFTLAIFCLTTSNLPWFMDLTFQVPMQYCSLQHQILLLSPVTSTTGYCFCFGSIPSFFLELFLHWSPVAYWGPNDLGSSSFSILSFCLFILFMGFSRQEYWSGLPFPSPVDHILSDLSTMTHPSWVPQQAWLGFIELDKAVVLVWLDWLVFCDYGFSVSAHWCPLATPIVLLGFLLPWMKDISSRPPLLTLDVRLLLSGKDPNCWERLKAKEKEAAENKLVSSITNSMDMNLSTLQEVMKDQEAWRAIVHEVVSS